MTSGNIFHIPDSQYSIWSSLPAQVVHASSVNDFKNKLDAHWSNQEMIHNYPVEISGTGSRSNVQ